MNNENKLRVFETPEILSEAAAELMVQIAANSLAERGRFVISLSGGKTPERLFKILAESPFYTKIQWANTFIFWGDERCVPYNDERNNAHRARILLIDKIPIPSDNVFPIPVNMEPAEAARQYEETIKDYFGNKTPGFDLILLGLGENGHTASLFPETEVLHEKTALVKQVYVEEQKMFRITMTAPLLNLARNILFLVTGKSKSEILKTVLEGPMETDKYPAQLIKPAVGDLWWFADKAAAADLKSE